MSRRPLHLFIFADALGWELAQRYRVLEAELPQRMPCATLFGYSSTCDPTILTGTLPSEHGHFSCFVKARGQSPFAELGKWGWVPELIAGHHRVRNRVSRAMGAKLGYTGYFQLYSVPFRYLPFLDYTEKRDLYAPGGILGGQKTIVDYWREQQVRAFVSDWRAGDAANLAAIRDHLDRDACDIGYLFTAGLDAVMHRHGTGGGIVEAAFAEFGRAVAGLLELARQRGREPYFYVFADHGMADTRKTSDLWHRFEQAFQRYPFGRDYTAVWDSTMARFWAVDDRVRSEIAAWLRAQPDGRLVDESELKRWGTWWPDHRYGEIYYLLPEGSLFVPSFMNQRWVTGMHGYDPATPSMTAAFLTNHPTAQANALPEIYGVMRAATAALR